MLSEIMKAETDVRNSSTPRLALEMALIRASFLSTMKPLKEVIENIDLYSRQVMGTAGASVQNAKPSDKAGLSSQTEPPAVETRQPAEPARFHPAEQTSEEEIPEEPLADIPDLSEDITDAEDIDESIEDDLTGHASCHRREFVLCLGKDTRENRPASRFKNFSGEC